MSEIANSFILTAYSYKIAESIPSWVTGDLQQDFSYLDKMTPGERQTYYSRDALYSLGRIAAAHYFKVGEVCDEGNPLILTAKAHFTELLPGQRPVSSKKIGKFVNDISKAELGLPRMMILPILKMPTLRDELLEKWEVAMDVYDRHPPISYKSGHPKYDYDVDFYSFATGSKEHAFTAFVWALDDLSVLAGKIQK